jgi:hypothetical protein
MINFDKAFRDAWNHQKKLLFLPFDMGKWCALGFSAWLASFLYGGSNINFPGGNGFEFPSRSSAKSSAASQEFFEFAIGLGLPAWLMIFALFILIICLISFFMIALGCRGKFMFIHNVLHDRQEIKKPWKEFAPQANELTIWYFVLSTIPLLILFAYFSIALVFFWGDIVSQTARGFTAYLPWIIGVFVLVLVFIPFGIISFLFQELGAPIMAKHRCSVPKTLTHLWHLLRTSFWSCLAFTGIRILMAICFVFLSILVGCLTCCLGLLPYISTVITLPYHVFQKAFTLNCLAQFGSDYDLWPTTPPPPPPPHFPPS